MSFRDCVDTLVSGGKLSAKAGDELKKVWSQEFSRTRDTAAAKTAVLDHLERAATHGKRTALLQQHAVTAAESRVKNYRTASGHQDVARAIVKEMSDLDYDAKAIRNMAQSQMEEALHEGRRGAITGDLRRAFGEAKLRWENVVREAMGQATGDDTAKRVAGVWLKTAEDLRQRFNAAGGAVGKLKDWGMPQLHNPLAVMNAGMERWRAGIIDRLAPDRMVHPIHGRPMTRAEVLDALEPIYRNITSGGAVDRAPSRAPQGLGALHKRHADHRFLVFKSADDWLAYQADFGVRDPFAAMMAYVNTMSRDIAAMERLGPNPAQTIAYLRSVAEQQGGLAAAGQPAMLPAMKTKDAETHVRKALERAGAMWDLYRGATETPVGNRLATFTANARNVVSATALGASAISSITDVSLQAAARRLAGMDKASELAAFRSTMDNLRTKKAREAVAMGLGLEAAAHALAQQARYIGELQGSWWSRYLTDRALTAFLLTPWTQAGQHALGSDLMGHFHGAARGTQKALLILDAIKQGYDVPKIFGFDGSGSTQSHMLRLHDAAIAGVEDLLKKENRAADPVMRGRREAQLARLRADRDKVKNGSHVSPDVAEIIRNGDVDVMSLLDGPTRRTLQRHGITADEWGKMSGAMLAGATSDPHLTPRHIAALHVQGADKLAEKYLRMILREVDHGIISSDPETAAMMVSRTRPGTIVGEIIRTGKQFKAFGATLIVLQARRIAELALVEGGLKGVATAAKYASVLLFSNTLLGAAAMQMKEMSKGRDPLDMTEAKFWGAAIMQGGGLGIFGYFMFSELNRFGGSKGATAAGPLWSRVENIQNLTLGNMKDLIEGKPTRFGKEATQFVRQNVPMPFYLRLAWERVMLDELQRMIDPEAYKAFRQARMTRLRDYRQEYWWRPGASTPDRLPDFGRAVGLR